MTQQKPNSTAQIPKNDWRMEVLQAFQLRSNPREFIDYFHDDATFHMIGRTVDYSFGGVYRGKNQILDLLLKIDSEVELSNNKILDVIVDNDTIAIRRAICVRHHGTAAARALTLGNLVHLKDRLIADVFEYVDTSWLKELSGEDPSRR